MSMHIAIVSDRAEANQDRHNDIKIKAIANVKISYLWLLFLVK